MGGGQSRREPGEHGLRAGCSSSHHPSCALKQQQQKGWQKQRGAAGRGAVEETILGKLRLPDPSRLSGA